MTAALLLATPLAAQATVPSPTRAAAASAVTQIDYRCGPYGHWVHSHYTPYGYVYGHCARNRWHRHWYWERY